VHATHLALIEELHEMRPDLVIAMEMFERDTQTAVLQYLTGVLDEPAFRVSARAPHDYMRDYRPVMEFAKANGIDVIAANAPHELASRVVNQGIESVAGNRDVARETNAPEDEYYQAFVAGMKGHPGVTDDKLRSYYVAQCLKDDTMAESITDYLAARAPDQRPLVVLICGTMHSDYRRGTVARIVSRAPSLQVRVLSAEAVDDADKGPFACKRGIGEYVVVVKRGEPELEVEDEATDEPAVAAAPSQKQAPGAVAAAKTAPAAAPEAADPGARPGLGLMLDYNASDEARIATVREDGPAEQAGLQPGDVVIALAGTRVEDVQSYTKVLDEQRIGSTIPVRVRRGNGEVEVQVKVGARAH
jgi:uncharacterized iron-regulated protein